MGVGWDVSNILLSLHIYYLQLTSFNSFAICCICILTCYHNVAMNNKWIWTSLIFFSEFPHLLGINLSPKNTYIKHKPIFKKNVETPPFCLLLPCFYIIFYFPKLSIEIWCSKMWNFILISEVPLYILFARCLRWKGGFVLYCLSLFHVKHYHFLNIKPLDRGLEYSF